MSPVSKQALRLFEEKFAKSFGEGRLRRGAGAAYDIVSTGSLKLDYALGVGGLIVGRCYESWGEPSMGKSTMNLLMAAEQQRRFDDKMIGWIDVERTFDEAWARAHGVDVDRLFVVSPNTAEEVSDQVRALMDSGLCSYVTVDSIGALISKSEIEKDAEEATVGKVAKIVTRMIRMAAPAAADKGVTFHVINQTRANIGAYGADTTGSGGFALQHGNTAKIAYRATGETPLMTGEGKTKTIVGRTFNLTVIKNKVAPPGRAAMVTLKNTATAEYGPIGLDLAGEAFTLADTFGLIERKGAWYTLHDGSRHNGGDAVRTHLRAHPDQITRIRDEALASISHTVITDPLKEGSVDAQGKLA